MTTASKFVFFDDSKEAGMRFKKQMKIENIDVKLFFDPYLDEAVITKLQQFKPDLIIVDLVIGESKTEGYQLIEHLQGIENIKDVPIVVCSKLINDSLIGKSEKESMLNTPGVVAAFSKFPDFPSADKFLKHAK